MNEKELPENIREDNLSEETKTLISSLPSTKDFLGKLYNYQGCWYYPNTLLGVLNFQKGFKPQQTDIILASYPKSGTTWLKALTVALLERSKNSSSDVPHPLQSENPHGLVPFLEFNLFLNSSTPDLTKFSSTSSPRLFSTHMPFHTLQVPFRDSPCKIVYVCRDVKDVLVSQWYFSLEDPEHVLFMRYEEMKSEPSSQVKRLAEFLGCPFTEEVEEQGSVDKILELCSLRSLSGMEINKIGKSLNSNIHNSVHFRKGEVGDSKNHLTPEMENKIDMIVKEKYKGSGLKF
ncbi:Cytosolic sulfotransferase 9 [Hirschfeldia incana]|nr:Cytosolic sulfotransferase 9 [Hirschfeldia incana]